MSSKSEMIFKSSRIKHDVAYWALLVSGSVAFFLLNHHTVLMEEDMFHATIEGTHGQPITSVIDVFRSWWNHYLDCNGRTSNLIDYSFNGLLGKPLFDICNTLVFGLLAHLVSRLSSGRNSVTVLALFYAFVMWAVPFPGETMLWLAGSCNYMWVVTASLVFVAYLLKHRNLFPSWPLGIAIVVLAFLAGGGNEGTTMGFAAGLVLYYLFNRDKVDRVVILAMTGYLLGTVMLLTSPGSWARAADEVGYDMSMSSTIINRLKLIAYQSVKYVAPALAVIACLSALFNSSHRVKLMKTPWPMIFLCLMGFVFVVGKEQERLFMAFAIVAFIIISMALAHILDRYRWIGPVVVVMSLSSCIYRYPHHLNSIRHFQAYYQGIDEVIKQNKERQAIVKVRPFHEYTRFMKVFYLDSWNYFIYEEPLCIHYDKENIQFVSDSIYSRYYGDCLLEGAEPMPFTSSHPHEVEDILGVSGPNFIAVKMRRNTITYSYQFAQVFDHDGKALTPVFFFPIRYNGHEYFLFPMFDETIDQVSFSALGLEREDVRLIRVGANPEWAAKVIE